MRLYQPGRPCLNPFNQVISSKCDCTPHIRGLCSRVLIPSIRSFPQNQGQVAAHAELESACLNPFNQVISSKWVLYGVRYGVWYGLVLIPSIRSFPQNKRMEQLSDFPRFKVLIPSIRSFPQNGDEAAACSRQVKNVLIPSIRSFPQNEVWKMRKIRGWQGLNPFNQVISSKLPWMRPMRPCCSHCLNPFNQVISSKSIGYGRVFPQSASLNPFNQVISSKLYQPGRPLGPPSMIGLNPFNQVISSKFLKIQTWSKGLEAGLNPFNQVISSKLAAHAELEAAWAAGLNPFNQVISSKFILLSWQSTKFRQMS